MCLSAHLALSHVRRVAQLSQSHPFVAPAGIPMTNARWAKRKTMKTDAIAKSIAIASSATRAGLWATATVGLKAEVLARRYCRPTGSGYCLSFQNIT